MSRTQLSAIVSAIILLALVLELVRRRRLREEYSWLWLLASCAYLLVALLPGMSRWVGRLIGTTNLETALTFIGIFFVVLILIQYSVRLSRLTEQAKNLAQQLAILDSDERRFTATPQQEKSNGRTKAGETAPLDRSRVGN